ncbi:hypothetical protein CVT26_009707 [Gymnopilus dilepis]|uniref:Uncharacterized protein n=1 Tax=Gymnopilus dilepis TaxID=231916 RepID=A0A409WCS5_9AGAR|nr:hypothetical protein CVT26_009707 [Gymnopilus dilepis]
MNKHLISTKKRCSGYLKGKLRDLGTDDDQFQLASLDTLPQGDYDDHWVDEDAEEIPYEPFFFEPLNDGINSHHFLPQENSGRQPDAGPSDQNAVAGPGPSTAANAILTNTQKAIPDGDRLLVDQEDPRRTIWTEGAGEVLRKTVPPLFRPSDVQDEQGDIQMAEGDSSFFPFLSELDWKVAQWAIKDGPGQNALDRLLEIPGVSSISYLIEFH